MCPTDDQILIRDLSVQGIIGVYDWERHTPQEMLINLTLFVDLHLPGKSDDINDTINYASVADKVSQLASTATRLTIEALAADLARLCLAEPGVHRVRVRVEKPGAVSSARSVGVEIERTAQDFTG